MAIKKQNCSEVGHNYQLASSDDNTRVTNDEGNTEIWRTFICTKCGETIDRKTAVWQKRISKNNSSREVDF